MKDETLACSHCEAEIQAEHDYYNYDKDENVLCENCYYDTFNHATTVLCSTVGETNSTKYIFNPSTGKAYSSECLEELWGDEEYYMPVEKMEWVNTDGWRGYYELELKDGYTSVANGWSTGSWDDVPWKHAFNDFMEAIFTEEDNGVYPPCDVWCILSPTSNVFSTSTELVVRSQDLETFKEWMVNEYGLSEETLELSLR